MKKITVSLVSMAALLFVALGASYAQSKGDCCNGSSCCSKGAACCRTHRSK